LLSKFDSIGVSNGTLHSPRNEHAESAEQYFKEFIMPRIDDSVEISYEHSMSGKFDGEELFCVDPNINFVGRLRSESDKGRLSGEFIRKAKIRKGKNWPCTKKNVLEIFFRKEFGKARMYFMLCCQPGLSPYTSHRTGMTLEDMASANPSDVKNMLQKEMKDISKNPVFNMLSSYEPWGKKVHGLPQWDELFDAYLGLVKELTGKNVVRNTYTIGNTECDPCEACYTASLLLKRAGISPAEWHAHIEERYEK
jgi:hypothetical protein